MNCSQCGATAKAGRSFCSACGHPLERTCPRCGFAADPDDRFCGKCGTALEAAAVAPRAYTPRHLADRILTSRSALEGERKLVTVLFCDIVESTRLAGASIRNRCTT